MKMANKNYGSICKLMFGASLAFFASGIAVAAEGISVSPHADAVERILQQKTVNGRVLDTMGEPIIGANVLVKGTTNGTITDLDGHFVLEVPTECTLQVSYIGFNTQEIKVSSTTTDVTVNLKEDTETLEEVVVVGYGTQKKVNLSGSLSTVNVGELTESRPITNVSHALSGLAAGVNVQMSSNQPGNDDAAIKVLLTTLLH